jgi:hypothetical protein
MEDVMWMCGITMGIEKERNRIALERILFHLDEAMRFCYQLDLSGLDPLEQTEWDRTMKTCGDAIMFGRHSVGKLTEILE